MVGELMVREPKQCWIGMKGRRNDWTTARDNEAVYYGDATESRKRSWAVRGRGGRVKRRNGYDAQGECTK
jgi:hypothetical protein